MLIGIIGNISKAETPGSIRSLVEILNKRGIAFLLHDALLDMTEDLRGLGEFVASGAIRERVDLVIAFGGDGTMLSTSRMLAGSGVPLLGINLGKLGFLAEFSPDTMEQTLDDFLNGECRVVERSLLQATFPDTPGLEPVIGLNDIVIDKRDGSLMLRLETSINGDYLGTYNADGLILATPTGSTAYSLAVGGPVVAPSARVMVIAPIAPHMLTARPVVVPDGATIEVRPTSHRHEETLRVYADGQVHRDVPMGSRIVITRHEHMAYLVKRTSTTYFDVLRAKLLWGIEPVLNVRSTVSDD
jgi:NAD+ kinase